MDTVSVMEGELTLPGRPMYSDFWKLDCLTRLTEEKFKYVVMCADGEVSKQSTEVTYMLQT